MQLPYNTSDLEPAIDTETMKLHYNRHYATYVKNLNAALNNATGIPNKTNLTGKVTVTPRYMSVVSITALTTYSTLLSLSKLLHKDYSWDIQRGSDAVYAGLCS